MQSLKTRRTAMHRIFRFHCGIARILDPGSWMSLTGYLGKGVAVPHGDTTVGTYRVMMTLDCTPFSATKNKIVSHVSQPVLGRRCRGTSVKPLPLLLDRLLQC